MKAGEGTTSIGAADPRWAGMIAGFVNHLRNSKHYTVIRYYNYCNEPNLSGDRGRKAYETWVVGMRNLHKEFESRGLAKDVCIIGPDAFCSTEPMPDGSMSRDKFAAFTWLNRAAKDIPQVIGAYDLHWYANDDDVRDGLIEQLLREKRELLLQTDPQARTKPIFIGESGMLTGKINGDQQPRVKLFEYGVLMADYVAQVARAGWISAKAHGTWMTPCTSSSKGRRHPFREI